MTTNFIYCKQDNEIQTTDMLQNPKFSPHIVNISK